MISDEDREYMQLVTSQLRQAERNLIAAKGAYNTVAAMLRKRYNITANDQLTIDGRILRNTNGIVDAIVE